MNSPRSHAWCCWRSPRLPRCSPAASCAARTAQQAGCRASWWAAAVVSAAGTAAVAASDVLHVTGERTAVLASATGLLVAVVLWWCRRDVLQHVAVFGATVATLLTGLEWLDAINYIGQLLWVFGLAWIIAAATGRFTSATTGWVLGSLAVIGGPLVADAWRESWLVVGVLSAGGVIVGGVLARRSWVVVVGTAGLFASVPIAVTELFDAELGPLIVLFLLGLLLVVVAVPLSRRSATPTPTKQPDQASGEHL